MNYFKRSAIVTLLIFIIPIVIFIGIIIPLCNFKSQEAQKIKKQLYIAKNFVDYRLHAILEGKPVIPKIKTDEELCMNVLNIGQGANIKYTSMVMEFNDNVAIVRVKIVGASAIHKTKGQLEYSLSKKNKLWNIQSVRLYKNESWD